MQDFSPFPGFTQSDAGTTPLPAKPSLKVRKADYAYVPQPKRGWVNRITGMFRKLFARATPAAVSGEIIPIPTVFAQSEAKAASLAFRAGASVTLISPVGTYAGKPPGDRLRQMAEQQFHHMDITHETAIN